MSLIDRRRFGVLLASLEWAAAAMQGAGSSEPEVLLLKQNGWMPNNERLPVLLYRAASKPTGDVAARMENVFNSNGWPAQWRNGVYPFHHYHSTAHEVLGFAAGEARIMLGGENGREVTVRAGDVALLPAGTGHCRIQASGDFLVVGAYPKGQSWDLLRAAADAATLARIRSVPFPNVDPVLGGESGPLSRHWKRG